MTLINNVEVWSGGCDGHY